MNPRSRRLAHLQRIAIVAFLAFWTYFLLDRGEFPANVADFEYCFILPDLLWIAGLLWFSSRWLMAGDARGVPASGVAGGALVFLGLLDLMFNLRHGQYTVSISTGILNGAVNSACVLFGLWNVRYAVFARRGD